MIRKISPLLFGFLVIMSVGSLVALAQNKEIDLKDKRITIQMAHKPLYTVFVRLFNKYDIAVGFEESILDREHQHFEFETNIETGERKAEMGGDKEILPAVPPFKEHLLTLNFKDARLDEVMDSIVKQMENYDWEINDGVVNIFPIRERDSRLKKLLDLRVSNFAMPQGRPLEYIQIQLMMFLPEFKDFLTENKLESNCERRVTNDTDLNRPLPSEMNFSDLTFKELLNSITKLKRGGWILRIKTYKEFPGREFVEILI